MNGCANWTIEGLHAESLDLDSSAVLSDTSYRDGLLTGSYRWR